MSSTPCFLTHSVHVEIQGLGNW